MSHKNADTVVVLDFETTGLSPNLGDRAIEIGAVLIENGRITDRFQQLMNPGFLVNGFISSYTGISYAMLKSAPDCSSVTREFADFVGKYNLVAHNASFDKKFLDNEMMMAGSAYSGAFACSMLVARRLYQNAPDHKMGTLVRYKRLPTDGVFHRALADAEMTSHLWLRMLEDLEKQYQLSDVPFNLMQKLGRTAKGSVYTFLQKKARTEPA
ncbi:3'-5' exonuclease [Endozoicomonas acroporae]|uniref:3'-5' exonuclease n=1 Tax=Endozoicomonas acroporae TaxID=1701104 RepID=UPI003D7C136D